MRILIEEYQYEVAAIKDVLYGIDPLTNIEGKVSIHYVGYYYNSLLKIAYLFFPRYCFKVVKNQLTGRSLYSASTNRRRLQILTKRILSLNGNVISSISLRCGFIGRLWFIKMTSGMTVLLYIMPK